MRCLLCIALLLSSCSLSTQQSEKKETAQNVDSILQQTIQAYEKLASEKEPPPIAIDYDSSIWTDIGLVNSNILIDMKYATTENFVKEKMYKCGRCFLRKEVALEVLKIQTLLEKENLGLKLFDCLRPRPVQQKLWEKVPDPRYVSDPKKGSMHNRGSAVDLTLVNQNGEELDMGTAFDYFGKEAYPAYTDLPENVLENRKKLQTIMTENGFKGIRTEWWHFSFTKKYYEISDMEWNCK